MIDDGLDEFMQVVGTRTKLIYYIQCEMGRTSKNEHQWNAVELYILRQEPKGAYLLEERKGRTESSWISILQNIATCCRRGAAEITKHSISEDTRPKGYLEHDGDRYYIMPNNYDVGIPDDSPDPPDACNGGG